MKKVLYIITLFTVGTGAYFAGANNTAEAISTVQPIEIDQAISVPDGFIDIASEEFTENYIDLRTVTGYSGTDTGLTLYTGDRDGYYLETPQVK